MICITSPLAELYTPIEEDLRAVERCFDQELLSRFSVVTALCDHIRRYRGKMLRPAILLLTGKACGKVGSDHHTLAAVVEMVHVATLVHDDVLDEADVRRQSETVNASAGNIQAVLLGDYLISHAYHLCSSLDSQYAARLIGATTNTVCEGELLQNHHRGDVELSEARYVEIIGCKTAALTATACELGASFAQDDEGVTRAMRTYGYSVGLAFQIVDDVLDVVGMEDQMGKSLGRDFDLGKPTLPIIHCLAHAAESVTSQLSQALTKQTNTDRAMLRQWLETSGSFDYALDVARSHVAEALLALEALPPSEGRSSLRALAEFIIRRSN